MGSGLLVISEAPAPGAFADMEKVLEKRGKEERRAQLPEARRQSRMPPTAPAGSLGASASSHRKLDILLKFCDRKSTYCSQPWVRRGAETDGSSARTVPDPAHGPAAILMPLP